MLQIKKILLPTGATITEKNNLIIIQIGKRQRVYSKTLTDDKVIYDYINKELTKTATEVNMNIFKGVEDNGSS